MRGVNYLDRNLRRHLEEPSDAIFDNDVASAVAFVRHHFKHSGTQNWHRVAVEWLVVHLMTEIGVTPHSDRQGYNAPTLEVAYQEVIQQFVSQLISSRYQCDFTDLVPVAKMQIHRRDDHFNRKDRYEPAELIQDMLICKDELRRITVVSQHREHVFETLRKDVERIEKEDLEQGRLPEHPGEASALEKVQTALSRSQRQSKAYNLLFEDIRMTLQSV